MAIIANRVKTFSAVPDLLLAIRALIIRFFSGGLILVSILLWYISADSKISKTIFDITASSFINPIVSIFDAVLDDIAQLQFSMINLWNAKQENVSLKLENARLARLLSEASHIHAENKQLREQLKLLDDNINGHSISGKIIGITNGIYKKTAIVNLGTKNAVSDNQVAISNGAIVGRITHVADYHAIIMLMSDRQSRIPVISAISGLRVILAGDGENGGELLYVPDGSDIKVGEMLFSSGDGKYYPSGIPIARVVKKTNGRIYAEPIASLSNIKFVSILQ
jgi:rod shape-determining protein MreC